MITREDIQSFLDRLDGGSLTVREVEPNLWLTRTADDAEVVVHYAPPVVILRVRVMELPASEPRRGELFRQLLEQILPGGTAYITDVGMTGPRGGVIGVRKEQAIESLRTHMSVRFDTAEDDPWLMGVFVRCAEVPLRAESIEQLLLPWQAGQGT
jgi:hypothetical protein